MKTKVTRKVANKISVESELTQTTTEQVELQEVYDILTEIQKAACRDGFTLPELFVRSDSVISALITIMVAKGMITKQDVKCILASPRTSV